MAFHPMKRDAMGFFRLQEALPKIGVFHGLLLCVFPTSLEPSFNPMLVEGVHHVLGVRDDVDLARAFKHFKSGDNAQKLHSIVGCAIETLRKLLDMQLPRGIGVMQNRPVSSRPRVSAR